MSSIAHFLVANGAVRAVVNYALVGLLGWLVCLARRFIAHERQALEHQHQIRELLRTDTPGGLHDVVAACSPTPGKDRGKRGPK